MIMSYFFLYFRRARAFAIRILDHFIFRILTILLIIIDLCIVIVSIVISQTAEDPTDPEVIHKLNALDYTALGFSCYFILEVSTRIFAQTLVLSQSDRCISCLLSQSDSYFWFFFCSPKVFFRQILEIIDTAVVLISFIVVVIDLAVDETALIYSKYVISLETSLLMSRIPNTLSYILHIPSRYTSYRVFDIQVYLMCMECAFLSPMLILFLFVHWFVYMQL